MTAADRSPATAQHVLHAIDGALARRLAVEAIGTFFLVFTVGTAVHSGSALAPLAIGAALAVMIYAGGHISGGHYNPAVTMAALVRGRIEASVATGYWVAQLAAGVVAALIVRAVTGPAADRSLSPSGHLLAGALTVELPFTFALAYVVLNVATSADHPRNSFYGLAIGGTVAAGAIAVGGISGAAFNPAVVLGGMTMGLFGPVTLLYVIAELVGGALAGLAFRALNPSDR
ncbi:MIP/aquaporin family protein [Nocardia terpenica]|uniref:Major intrinsic protein/permease n=1 Tax=Nocardia terpenica TaxID=455432 RepID=A0A0U1YZ60_9NOCA|nr:aquaporin [Nocardia terpenica]AJO72698.1 Major intrinsic protein/permease [Nocardia terpenica]NQE85778.1 porin [Nocardia terpenica]